MRFRELREGGERREGEERREGGERRALKVVYFVQKKNIMIYQQFFLFYITLINKLLFP